MKKYTLLLAFVTLASAANAQLFNLGVKAGANLPGAQIDNFKPANASATYENVKAGDRKVGFHAGLFTRFNLAILHLQPEAYYTYINQSIVAEDGSGTNKNIDLSYGRVDVPVLVGKSLGPIRINLGPVVSFNVAQQNDVVDEGLKGGTIGYQGGIGVDIGKFSIDATYEGAFSNTSESVTIEGETYPADLRTNQIILSLGYKLIGD